MKPRGPPVAEDDDRQKDEPCGADCYKAFLAQKMQTLEKAGTLSDMDRSALAEHLLESLPEHDDGADNAVKRVIQEDKPRCRCVH